MEHLLNKIRELNPSCVVKFIDPVPLEIQKLFLVFVARMQLGSSKMYHRYNVKLCQYLRRPFYRLSFAFTSDGNGNQYVEPHFYPFVNVDCETLNMFHATGKVARANLSEKNYVCLGYGWLESNSKLVSDEERKICSDFVQQHNLV